MNYQYNHVALGGTFDHLHKGHEFIIQFALNYGKKVSIAIATTNLFKEKKFRRTIEHYTFRKEAVEKYIKSIKSEDRVSIFELNDIYGSTLVDRTIDAIVVTKETEANAKRINEERQKKGLPLLSILTCPYVKGPDKNVISSTNIRGGSTNRFGFPYSSLFYASTLYLPKKLRSTLREPLEPPIFVDDETATAKSVISKINQSGVITIGVGDIVNKTLISAGYTPDLQIIDLRTRRQSINSEHLQQSGPHLTNRPGTINKEVVIQINNKIQNYLNDDKKQVLIIDGEEDLLALPAILLAPLDGFVVYGQFDKGIVVIGITESIKENVVKLVKQFRTTS